jgi:predicted ATPase
MPPIVRAPYLQSLRLLPERIPNPDAYPWNLPFVGNLAVELASAVTFFVGENGSGKSTVIEAIAALADLPASGGGRNDLASRTGPDDSAPLARALRPSFRERPRDGFFFRAEHMAHFAELLDARKADPDFLGDPYQRYGGRSLHTRSHGETFLSVLEGVLRGGLILMDEPESALSPQRQLSLLARMARLVGEGRTQFIVATHSAILLTFPGAQILSFDDGQIEPVTLEETRHYQITRGILEEPARYWKHLLDEDA